MKKNFTQISTAIIKDKNLTDAVFRTYSVLKSYKYGDDGRVFPSQSTIATHLGKTREIINRHIQVLRTKGYIDYYKRGYSLTNEYVFNEDNSDKDVIDEFISRSLSDDALTPTVKKDTQQELNESHTNNTLGNNTKIKNTKPEPDLTIGRASNLANLEKMKEDLVKKKGFNFKK